MNRPFNEEDFRQISELGFNFVRLPMDYRVWTDPYDPYQLNENVLEEIDQAVQWGMKYGIHVCINFHRAPGYCVNSNPPEERDLWHDPYIQKVCAHHWKEFARRYKGIPNAQLSFNLFNEPANITAKEYVWVVKIMLDAIRSVDPERLVICDGLDYGAAPVYELIPLKVAQAFRGYKPFELTHYKAGWVPGSDLWPEPAWPIPIIASHLYGPAKSQFQSAMVLETVEGFFTRIGIHVDTVSSSSTLRITDREGNVFGEKSFVSLPNDPEAVRSDYKPEWDIYWSTYDKVYWFDLPRQTAVVKLTNIAGDWMTISKVILKVSDSGKETTNQLTATDRNWGTRQGVIRLENGRIWTTERIDAETLEKEMLVRWNALKESGVGVMVGEFGAYSETPHDVVLSWMRDYLRLLEKYGIGWALWNYRGSFGPLDSQRKDVVYKDWKGLKMDEAMMALLRRFNGSMTN
jgi:aryl-phospho-beta-D-glucosidase BglC (GH1 family)